MNLARPNKNGRRVEDLASPHGVGRLPAWDRQLAQVVLLERTRPVQLPAVVARKLRVAGSIPVVRFQAAS
jgi:hypothetical protein